MVIRSDVCLMLNHLNGKRYRYHRPPDSCERNGLLPLLGEKAPIFSRRDQLGQQQSFVLSAVSYTKKPPKPSINIFLSLFMRSERGCNVTTGCTSCSLRVFTPFMVFWSLLANFSGSRFNVYFIFGGLHLVYDSNETHKFLMNNTTASCIYAGCA